MLAIAWMLTYLLHSTLLLGLAALVSKPLSRWSVAAEEIVWKVALVGALFTASLQLAAGWQPVAGLWNLADPVPAATVVQAPVPAADVPTIPLREIPAMPARMIPVTGPAAAAPAAPRLTASNLILSVWALGALVLLAASARSVLRLSRRLRSRPRVVGGTLHAQLRGLAAEAGLGGAVRLSCSSRVPVPVALGVRRREICVPPRAVAGLTDEQQEGMLAHELAHLARRDPFWLLLTQGIASALFFQPLNWVARRRLREISEVLSDEWAVARTGRPLSLAACLAEVAGWSVGRSMLPVPGMADRPSSLGRRIRRLLDGTRSPEHPARRIWLAAAMGLLVVAVAALAPAVSAARPEPPPAKAPAATPTAGAPSFTPVAIDVNDATDTPSHPAAAEPERAANVDDDHASHPVVKEREGDEDAPDVDVNVDVNLDDIGDAVGDSVQASLDALDGQFDVLSKSHEMSGEQREKLSRDLERMNREIQRSLKPRLEKLSHELAERSAHMAPTPEMQRLTQEMAKLGAQMRPSTEEMARMQAQLAEDMKKLHVDGTQVELSREDRERIEHQAREMAAMATKMKPTEEQRRRMDELRAQLQRESSKMGEQFRAENREEIEKIQREVREEVEREMQGVREEIRHAMEERKAIERQDRLDRKNHPSRHDAKPDPDDDPDGNGAPKPPAKPSSGC